MTHTLGTRFTQALGIAIAIAGLGILLGPFGAVLAHAATDACWLLIAGTLALMVTGLDSRPTP